jgi:hypothetical protein
VFGCSLDDGLLVASKSYNSRIKERTIKGYWSARLNTYINLGEDTHIGLGVLGVWGLKEKHSDKCVFKSQAHKIGSIISATVWRLPENLIKHGYAQSETDREARKKERVELTIPNGIYLEMMRESQERKLTYNALAHEAILNTSKLSPLAFGGGSKRMAFAFDNYDIETIQSFSSIHQLDPRDVLRLILGAYFFVGEETSNFLAHNDGTKSELWD